ncbi:Sorting nexin, cytoplasm-to-vacuole targeting pathway/endosomal sorting [Malassezia pachydermatis]
MLLFHRYVRHPTHTPQGLEAKRRYSEFEALRDALVQLHPTLIIPPIPSKHSLSDYAMKQGRAKVDPAIMTKRTRMLERFLRRIDTHPVLRHDIVFRRFLDSRYTWHEIKNTAPLTMLPKNNLAAPPQQPANPDAPGFYLVLPTPSTTAKLQTPHTRFQDSEAFTNRFESHMAHSMEPVNRRLVRRWQDIGHDFAELGTLLHAQAPSEAEALAPLVDKVAEAAEKTSESINEMTQAWESQITEPLNEYTQYGTILQKIIKWRHLKQQQLETTQDSLEQKRQQLKAMERVEAEAARLQQALETGGASLMASQTEAQQPSQRVSVYGRAAEMEEEDPWATPSTKAKDRMPEPEVASAPSSTMPIEAATLASIKPTSRGILGSLSDTLASVMDRDPDRTRQANLARLRAEVVLVRCKSTYTLTRQLQDGLTQSLKDMEYVNSSIQASLDRFQRLKVADFRKLMLDMAYMQREHCAKVRHYYMTYAPEPRGLAPSTRSGEAHRGRGMGGYAGCAFALQGPWLYDTAQWRRLSRKQRPITRLRGLCQKPRATST